MAGRYHLILHYLCGASFLVASCTEPTVNRWIYACNDGYHVSVRFRTEPEEVLLEEPGGNIRLRRVPSGSGAKYSDGRLTFWSKGREASIESDGEIVHRRCIGEPA